MAVIEEGQATIPSTVIDYAAFYAQGAIPAAVAPAVPVYDVQPIQSIAPQTQDISFATPTEQAAAQGGGVPDQIDPYFADLGAGTQYLYSQWPYSAGGAGTGSR